MWVVVGSSLFALEVDAPKEITPEWEFKVLGIRYGITDLSGAVEEMTIGITNPYFGEEFLEKIRETVKKQATGEYVEYWGNGQIKAKLPYKDGKAEGHIHGWYEDGKDAFKGFFKEGVKQGIHITFYPPGIERYPSDARILTYNEIGQLDGEQTTTYPTRHLAAYIEYKNGKAEGSLGSWDTNRKQLIAAEYKKGKLKKIIPLETVKGHALMKRRDEKYVDEVIRDFEKMVAKEFKIKATGSGAGMPFDVERISVKFTVYRKSTIEEARELLVNLKERLADIVNRHEKLRPYLREYPFTPLRAEVNLSFCNKANGEPYLDGSVSFIMVGKGGKVFYLTKNAQTRKSEDLFEESYEDAVKIVKAKKE